MIGGSSAASWGMQVNGPVDAQYNRVFGPEYANVPGNVIIGAQGQNITPATRIPTPEQLLLAQSGGKRRRYSGILGEIVDESSLPSAGVIALLGVKKSRRKRGGRRHTRRHRKH
jgi:hypothetical protein